MVIFGISCLGLGINYLGIGLNILGLGDSIFDHENNHSTLGLLQGLDLLALALVLGSRTILTSLLSRGHLSLLALVTSLAKPFGDFKRRKRGLSGGGLLRGGRARAEGEGAPLELLGCPLGRRCS